MSNHNYYGQNPAYQGSQYPNHQYYAEQSYPPLPEYTSQAPSAYQAPVHSTNSPFEAPFDDHVYPAAPSRQESQTSYINQGGGGRLQDPAGTSRDDIPLQTHLNSNGKAYPMEETDHVYDDPNAEHVPPVERRRRRRREEEYVKRPWYDIAWVVWIFTIVQVSVFIAELAKNATLTGSPIMIHPSFNPMIGPSTYVMINMGARFVECMHNVEGVQDSTVVIGWPCPNSTTSDASDPSNQCTLSELCGFNGVPNPVAGGSIDDKPEPNQWFRFITPMFLHAGIIHIGFNMILQCTLGREMEMKIGHFRFFLVYVSAGIFGFVMGGNFAATGIASTGASGCLFGIIALNLLDLLYTWQTRLNPKRELAFILLDICISFVLGLLPGLDNFSHIGGFLMGIVLGVCILRSPLAIRKRTGEGEPPYTPVSKYVDEDIDGKNGFTRFIKNPVGFFKGRKGAWWAWWLIRLGALIGVLIAFILLLNNFYIYRKTCSWCKYLSCLPINNWCTIGNLQLSNTTTKRSVLDSWEQMAQLYEVL